MSIENDIRDINSKLNKMQSDIDKIKSSLDKMNSTGFWDIVKTGFFLSLSTNIANIEKIVKKLDK
jgi:copper chaperone CopZ